MSDTDARLWHTWLRINCVLRAMLHERWSAEAWPQVKAEFKKACEPEIPDGCAAGRIPESAQVRFSVRVRPARG